MYTLTLYTQYQQQVPHIMPAACTNHNDSHRFHKLLYLYTYIYIYIYITCETCIMLL